jgi:uncharacterized membrane protein
MSGRRSRTVLALGLLTAFDVGLLGFRIEQTGRPSHVFLLWNLFLAWIPFLLALALYDRARQRRSPLVLGALALGWLLFFPNAPYILTDVIHISHQPGLLQWFDTLLFSAAGLTGLLLGFVSLGLVQDVVRRAVGAAWSWVLVGGVLTIASAGVYLGRFQRLNSWDVVTRPGSVLRLAWMRANDPFGNPKLIAVVLLLTVFLSVAYVVFSALWSEANEHV